MNKFKLNYLFIIISSVFLTSCGVDERYLGDNFIIYRDQETMRFTAIGLELSTGGTQGIIDGNIQKYGFNNKYIVAKLEDNQFIFFSKIKVREYFEIPVKTGNNQAKCPIVGPISELDFFKRAKELDLPCLSYSVRK